MACTQVLSNLYQDCTSSIGGVMGVYYANREDVTAKTVSDGMITAITMASSKHFYTLVPPKQTTSLTSTWNVDAANGTKYVNNSLSLTFNRMETDKRVAFQTLAEGEYVFIVKDKNGKHWFLGFDEAVTITGGEAGTGTAYGDRNGYTITMEDNSKELPYEVDETIIAGILS